MPLLILVDSDSNKDTEFSKTAFYRLAHKIALMEFRKKYKNAGFDKISMEYDQYNGKRPNSTGQSIIDYFFGAKHTNGSDNFVVGILVLCFIVAGVAIIFCTGFLVYRLCQRTLLDVHRKMTMDFTKAFPNIVAHPKRVYEIQAEEGVYSAPEPQNEEEQPREGSLKRTNSNGSSQYSSGDSSDEEVLVVQPNGQLPLNPPRPLPKEGNKDELPSNFRRKERKIHKDSVCAMIFKPQPEPQMM